MTAKTYITAEEHKAQTIIKMRETAKKLKTHNYIDATLSDEIVNEISKFNLIVKDDSNHEIHNGNQLFLPCIMSLDKLHRELEPQILPCHKIYTQITNLAMHYCLINMGDMFHRWDLLPNKYKGWHDFTNCLLMSLHKYYLALLELQNKSQTTALELFNQSINYLITTQRLLLKNSADTNTINRTNKDQARKRCFSDLDNGNPQIVPTMKLMQKHQAENKLKPMSYYYRLANESRESNQGKSMANWHKYVKKYL